MATRDTLVAETRMSIEREAFELLIEDPEWVAAEFAAIMQVSGLRERLVLATVPRPRRSFVTTGPPSRVGAALRPVVSSANAEYRVRSPPGSR